MNKQSKNFVTMQLTAAQETTINLSSTIIQFGLSLVISFFLSPYIVRTLGAEANGFVTLANNFISYFSVIIVALNGMASRFIAVAYHRGDKEQANRYYSSLFYGDLILTAVFSLVSVTCIWNLERIINISPELVADVKMLFALIFANYLLGVVTTIWTCATYVANKIYLNSLLNMQNVIVRAIVIVTAFSVLEPRIYYLGVATIVPAVIGYAANFYFKLKLIPEFRVSRKNCDMRALKELIGSGCWNSLSRIGGLLETGCDMLVTNLFIGPGPMGILSVARSMPGVIDGLTGTLSGVFLPSLIKDYAHEDREAIVKNIKTSAKIISIICAIPLCFLIVFGDSFYALWQPTLDAGQVHILSFLICMSYVLFTGTQSLFNIFTAYNKVKQNSISVLIMGAASIVLTIIAVKTTSLGIYAVTGVSSVVNICRYLVFVIPYAAKCMGLKWTTFYSIVGQSVVSVGILSAMGCGVKLLIPNDTWLMLILSGVVFACFGLGVQMLIVLNGAERKALLGMLRSKIRK